MRDTCKNCGGPKGLHHYETGQCPVNGVEAPIGRRQEWSFSRYEEEPDYSTAAELIELRSRLSSLEEANGKLFGLAVLAFRAVESLGFDELPEGVKPLDHYLANELGDELWERVEKALASNGYRCPKCEAPLVKGATCPHCNELASRAALSKEVKE